MSAGRHGFLEDDYCKTITLTADHPNEKGEKLEAEFLARMAHEVQIGNAGYWAVQLRKLQSPKPKKSKAVRKPR